MSVEIFRPDRTGVFEAYRPSKNAHTDILPPGGVQASQEARKGVQIVRLTLPQLVQEPGSQELLSSLEGSIAPILAGQTTPHSFHHLSATCHTLVLPPHSLGPTIYSGVKEELEKSIAGMAREFRASIMSRETGWLHRLTSGWKQWEMRVKLLSSVLIYLDKVYANDRNGIASIYALALATFKKGIWDNEVLFQKTRDDLLAWSGSERERSGPDNDLRPHVVSLTALSKLLSVFSTLSVPYVDFATEHYSSVAESNVASVETGGMSTTRYIEWALQKVEEEQERATTCLNSETAERVVKVVRAEGGAKMAKRVVRRALDDAMDQSDEAALRRLYTFTVDSDVFSELSQSLEAHLEARLQSIISDPANDSHMIEGSLKLKRFADRAVESLFSQDSQITAPTSSDGPDQATRVTSTRDQRNRQLELQDAIRNGFKLGMGSRQNAPAEWIAKHLDAAMRRGQGAGTEAEFNALLDEIVALIGFTRDKDVFRAFYTSQLAKRLLLNKSASDDMERTMIVKLQKEMGEEFTSGDVMMKDLQLSETLVKTYQTALAKDPSAPPAASILSANVLTESAWPAYPLLKDGWAFKLPSELQSSIDAFTSWYSTQHKNRQLSWRWQLATVTMSARFGSGKYEIGLSLFQAVVLMLFNEDDTLTFDEIKARTGIEPGELVRTLQSLSMGRKGTRVLVKKPVGKEVNPTDVFGFNKTFTSDRIKFRINQIQQDMSAEESRKTNEQVAVDRVSVLEATIVRIMKGRKKLTLQLLIDAVVTDVSKRFPPDVKEIKKRVESLIEREFLMRDEDDRNLLHYLA